ncbi:MAG: bifunctional glutamate N-acetyltransferase/amino-acid acetyltransferase ArgJ, partial [Candidatus Omnitrophota bacterium]|nr:bifunctional glutamate N-acetyltransferase/amino-acid acetyltransferase ArgJ [Candidatus Omnitrophota bacterium]
EYAAKALGLDNREVLTSSTGIIGRALPIGKIASAMPLLVNGLSARSGPAFSESILTTDTVKKELAVKIYLAGAVVTIGGSCKGVGMIYPEMMVEKHATMLCFIATDAVVSKKMLGQALAEAVAGSFNMISVDGDMSTNDSCFILANGLAGNRRISARNGGYKKFSEALRFLTRELAGMIVRDGEGATKFVEIEVCGAKNVKDARTAARKISTSNLLKCCVYGQDPNWGRIVAACGASGIDFEPDRVDVYLGGVKALSDGAISPDFDKDKAAKHFKEKEIKIKVDLKSGSSRAVAWTCDFSKEYVAINSEYSS